MAQQARNVAWELEELEILIKVLIRDRDTKYSCDLDAVFAAAGLRIARTPFRSPRANAACERVLGSLRRECLDWLTILGERHLVQVLREYFDHYNRSRPHRALGLRPSEPQPTPDGGVIVRTQRLHGLINEYSRAPEASRSAPMARVDWSVRQSPSGNGRSPCSAERAARSQHPRRDPAPAVMIEFSRPTRWRKGLSGPTPEAVLPLRGRGRALDSMRAGRAAALLRQAAARLYSRGSPPSLVITMT